ncbi:hypothetical protein MOU92_001875, partial [Vibrio parahaemolyticus]|nr:hypothetical protein [Vibrio parahaemolyticus]
MLEKELQSEIYKRLFGENLCCLIQGIKSYRDAVEVDVYSRDAFSTSSILKHRYAESVLFIYKMLEIAEYKIIGGESPKNISLSKGERLFPDFLLHDFERNFYVFELKVGTKTEREA